MEVEKSQTSSDEEDSLPSQSSFLSEVKERAEVLSKNVRAAPEVITDVKEADRDDEMEQYLAIIRATETLVQNPTLMGSHAPKNIKDAELDFSCIPNMPVQLNFEAQHFKASLAQRTLKRRRKPQTKAWVSSDEQAWFPKLPEGASSDSDNEDEKRSASSVESPNPSPRSTPTPPAKRMPGGFMADLGSMLKKRGSPKADKPTKVVKPSPKKKGAVPPPAAKPTPKAPARPPKPSKAKDAVNTSSPSPKKQPLLPPLPKPKAKKPATLPAGVEQVSSDKAEDKQNTKSPAWLSELENKHVGSNGTASQGKEESKGGISWLNELKDRKNKSSIKKNPSVDENCNTPKGESPTSAFEPTPPQCKIEDINIEKEGEKQPLVGENNSAKHKEEQKSSLSSSDKNDAILSDSVPKAKNNLNFIIFDGDEESVDVVNVDDNTLTKDSKQPIADESATIMDSHKKDDNASLIDLDSIKKTDSLMDELSNSRSVSNYDNKLSDDGNSPAVDLMIGDIKKCFDHEAQTALLSDKKEQNFPSKVDTEPDLVVVRSISPIDDFVMVDKNSIDLDFNSNGENQILTKVDSSDPFLGEQPTELKTNDSINIETAEDEKDKSTEISIDSNPILISPFGVERVKVEEGELPSLTDPFIPKSTNTSYSQSPGTLAFEKDATPSSNINALDANTSANLILWDDDCTQSVDDQVETDLGKQKENDPINNLSTETFSLNEDDACVATPFDVSGNTLNELGHVTKHEETDKSENAMSAQLHPLVDNDSVTSHSVATNNKVDDLKAVNKAEENNDIENTVSETLPPTESNICSTSPHFALYQNDQIQFATKTVDSNEIKAAPLPPINSSPHPLIPFFASENSDEKSATKTIENEERLNPTLPPSESSSLPPAESDPHLSHPADTADNSDEIHTKSKPEDGDNEIENSVASYPPSLLDDTTLSNTPVTVDCELKAVIKGEEVEGGTKDTVLPCINPVKSDSCSSTSSLSDFTSNTDANRSSFSNIESAKNEICLDEFLINKQPEKGEIIENEIKREEDNVSECAPVSVEESPFKLAHHIEKRLEKVNDEPNSNSGKLIRVNSMEAAPISKPRVVMKRYSMNEGSYTSSSINTEKDIYRHQVADNNKTNGCSDEDDMVFENKFEMQQPCDTSATNPTSRLVSVEATTLQKPLTPERDVSFGSKVIASAPERGNEDIILSGKPHIPPPIKRPPPLRPKPLPKPRTRKSSSSSSDTSSSSMSYKERHSEILSILSPTEHPTQKLSRRDSVTLMDKEIPSMISSARAYEEKQALAKQNRIASSPWHRKTQTLAPGTKPKPSLPPKPLPKPKSKFSPSPTNKIEPRYPWDESRKQERQMKSMSLPVHSSHGVSRVPDEPVLTEIDIKIAEAKRERKASEADTIPAFIKEFASKERSRSAPTKVEEGQIEPEWKLQALLVNAATESESGV